MVLYSDVTRIIAVADRAAAITRNTGGFVIGGNVSGIVAIGDYYFILIFCTAANTSHNDISRRIGSLTSSGNVARIIAFGNETGLESVTISVSINTTRLCKFT